MKTFVGRNMKTRVGRRVEVEGSKGTVMYEGSVDGTKGRWLGIEWDDPSRGKHDGSHNGVVYFQAKGPSTASFIRETKANFGKALMRAVNERYRTRLEPEVAAQMHVRGVSDQITAVQLVGNEKISQRQSRIDQLEDVHVSDMRVCGLEDDDGPVTSDEDSLYPVSCTSLGLAGCLLSSWEDVASITRPMTLLRSLHLDENRIPPPLLTHSPPEAPSHSLVDAFKSLKVITLTKMELDWSVVVECFPMWPALEELVLSNNSISTTSLSSSFPPRLRLLNIDGNPLTRWQNALPFAKLPHLETLSLAECGLGDIENPVTFFNDNDDCPSISSSSSSAGFPSLRHLNLRDNAVSSWLTVACLSRISSLTELVLLRNPVMASENSPETARQIVLVKMAKLTRLNHVYVDPKERRGAEIDYYKKYAAAYVEAMRDDGGNDSSTSATFRFEHPTYERLVAVYGNPEIVPTDERPNVLKKSLITVNVGVAKDGVDDQDVDPHSLDPAYPKVTKKVPASMSVQKVKMMALKAWKGVGGSGAGRMMAARDFQVRVVSEERSFEVENEMKEIGYYGVGNGDDLVLTRKRK